MTKMFTYVSKWHSQVHLRIRPPPMFSTLMWVRHSVRFNILQYFYCVLTGLRRRTVWPYYEVGFPKPQSVTVRTLDSVAYCYISSLALLSILITAIATTRVHPPAWASPVSDPASPSATLGNLPIIFIVERLLCFYSSLTKVILYTLGETLHVGLDAIWNQN